MAAANRVVNLRAVPDDFYDKSENVWLIVGPGWRNHLKWRLQHAFQNGWDTYWMGIGDLGDKIPPSGILDGRKDIQRLLKEWSAAASGEGGGGEVGMGRGGGRKVLFVEDPQGSGIWSELIKSNLWIELLSRTKELGCDIIIGTGSPLTMSRLVLENTDYLLIRCAGDDNIKFLTNGSRLTDWLDAIGRDLFDDIRVYRKILSLIGTRNRDLVVALTTDADTIPERIFWWDRIVREKLLDDVVSPPSNINSLPDSIHKSLVEYNGSGSNGNGYMLKAKVTAAIALLQEILADLK